MDNTYIVWYYLSFFDMDGVWYEKVMIGGVTVRHAVMTARRNFNLSLCLKIN